MEGKLELLSSKRIEGYDKMYHVVDFLNKSLKDRNLIFGLSKNQDGTMTISIYEAE
jgi:dsDNA-binding SOS-regulon protein